MATIRAVYEKKGTESFSSEDAQIVSFVREMLHSHRVTEPTYQAIYGRLGEQAMVELAATIGYYAMLACTLNTFDVATATAPEELKIA
jgi:4-carboxymuconolactone decarboxylase